ncbi:MAG: hypothetical protein GEEBNDBF_01844 [bacterium]|nr:hypothetical protein [bacterium]
MSTTRSSFVAFPLIRVRRGNTLVFTAIAGVSLMGFSTLVVDAGFLYREKTQMQRAADAAALAGARQLPQEIKAGQEAMRLAEENTYVDGVGGVTVVGTRNPDGLHPGWYEVEIARPVSLFFGPLLGMSNSTVRATATASFTSPLPMNINGGGVYGTNGIQNLSVFGKYAQYSYGDPFSPAWLDNGQDNPLHNPNGYDFKVDIPANYAAINGTNIVKVEIFDPDTWNVGNAVNAGAGRIDEIRSAPGGGHPQPTNIRTTTRFQLYAPSDTPNDPTDDILIAEAIYGPETTTATDMKWVTPAGFEFNLASYGAGGYRLNVCAIDGSSENGFNLRAGPPLESGEAFNPNNGTKVTATGNLPINFNVSGTVNIELGDLPAEAAGSNIYVDKFDTDVGAKSVTYYDDKGNTWPGRLSGNGTWKLDVLKIPNGYTGGKLYAQYQAGAQDTSVWQMYWDGGIPGGPSVLKLVK